MVPIRTAKNTLQFNAPIGTNSQIKETLPTFKKKKTHTKNMLGKDCYQNQFGKNFYFHYFLTNSQDICLSF